MLASYVDQASIVFKGEARHHMTSDSIDELHDFAGRVGIKRCWFHRGARHPHYDITDGQREAAIAAGAIAVDSRQLMLVARRLVRPVAGAKPAGQRTGVPDLADI